ncbi:putative carbonic anhydrase [Helianthus annuus]|nr:putative carbonic anhydrase [Helianthus annuus]KAJ0759179.1 putative carbonic anhydrase [Helianthus annuus]
MPGDLKRAYIDAPARLVNGHDNIGIEWLGDAGGIQVNGSTYKLHQCHWHTPSEHKIDGKKFDAELHIVHKNDKGQKAVISTLHTVGQSDPFIGSLTKKINMLGTKEEIDLGKISASSIKHEGKKYYRYIGSFTTPPCTEGVIWTIEEKVRSISKDQIKLLKGLHQRESRQNARPLQLLGGRPIWIFDIPEEKG